MLLISEADVKETLTMDDVIETVMSAYEDYSKKLIEIPSRITYPCNYWNRCADTDSIGRYKRPLQTILLYAYVNGN